MWRKTNEGGKSMNQMSEQVNDWTNVKCKTFVWNN